jgi:hypothetical protein
MTLRLGIAVEQTYLTWVDEVLAELEA